MYILGVSGVKSQFTVYSLFEVSYNRKYNSLHLLSIYNMAGRYWAKWSMYICMNIYIVGTLNEHSLVVF